MVLVAIVLICLAITFLFLHSKREATRRKKPKLGEPLHNAYRAASISPGRGACAEATALGDKRFLLELAPRMPMPECDAAKCDCTYVRHKDRRVKEDRRSPFCLQRNLQGVAGRSEHRIAGYSRRQSD